MQIFLFLDVGLTKINIEDIENLPRVTPEHTKTSIVAAVVIATIMMHCITSYHEGYNAIAS